MNWDDVFLAYCHQSEVGDYDEDYYDEEDDEEYLDIDFYRPDGSIEGKSISWCKSHGFFEIEPGLWSGDWYWRHFPDRKKEFDDEKKAKELAVENERRWREVMSDEERRAEDNEKRMSGLISEVYEDCPPDTRILAQIRRFEEGDYQFQCPRGYDEEEYEDITFYRPDGRTEGKSISWCKSNGFFEIQPGLWSGDWYWERFPEQKKALEEEKKANELAVENERKRREAMSDDERRAEDKKKLRSRLISEAYDVYPPDPRILTQIRRLEEEEDDSWQECPVCGDKFETPSLLDAHLQNQTGKGHARYRSSMALLCYDTFDG